MARLPSGRYVLLLAILLAAAALRFGDIGVQSLWNDEGNSYVQSIRTFSEIADHAGRDIHPPAYYWLLGGWRLLTGTSEFALRSLSTFASILTVAFVFALGWRLYGSVAGIAAGAVVVLNTFNIYYAQEARMYALLAMWSAAGFWALAEFLRRPSARWAIALALINAAGLYTQYAYPLFMLAQGIVAFIALIFPLIKSPDKNYYATEAPLVGLRPSDSRRFKPSAGHAPDDSRNIGDTFKPSAGHAPDDSRNTGDTLKPSAGLLLYIAANLLAVALFLPWLPTALHQIATWPRAADPLPPLEAFGALSRTLILGVVPTMNAPAIAIIILLFGALIVRRTPAWKWLLPISWALIPVILFVGLGLYQPDDIKLMLPAQVGVALWFGRGIWMLWTGHALSVRNRLRRLTGRGDGAGLASSSVIRAGMRLAALVSLLWMLTVLSEGLGALRTSETFLRADYRGIAAAIRSSLRPGDAVILDAPNQQEVFGYYFSGEASVYPLPVGLGGDDPATLAEVERIIGQHERIYAVFWGEAERDPNRVVETTLDARAFELRDDWYGDVRLAHYVSPVDLMISRESGEVFGGTITLVDYALNALEFALGDVLQVEFHWWVDAPVEIRYKVFVQILNTDGTLALQRDSEPGGGLSLTTTWTPGEIADDRHALEITLDPGSYTLIAGLYSLDNSTRLRLPDGSDHLVLETLEVR